MVGGPPEDRCPRLHYPLFLGSSRQGEVHPLSVPPTVWNVSRQTLCYPALERVQGSLHPLGEDPGLRPEEEDLMCHGNIKLRDTFGSAPSRPRILGSLPQVTRAFLRFPATAGQSSSVFVITLPR